MLLSVLSIGINGVLGGIAILVGLASESLSLLGFDLAVLALIGIDREGWPSVRMAPSTAATPEV